jgi:hypothetical protein
MKRYLLVVEGGTEPMTLGPFPSDKARLERAKELRAASDEDGVFRVDVLAGEKLRVSPFMSSEVDPNIIP